MSSPSADYVDSESELKRSSSQDHLELGATPVIFMRGLSTQSFQELGPVTPLLSRHARTVAASLESASGLNLDLDISGHHMVRDRVHSEIIKGLDYGRQARNHLLGSPSHRPSHHPKQQYISVVFCPLLGAHTPTPSQGNSDTSSPLSCRHHHGSSLAPPGEVTLSLCTFNDVHFMKERLSAKLRRLEGLHRPDLDETNIRLYYKGAEWTSGKPLQDYGVRDGEVVKLHYAVDKAELSLSPVLSCLSPKADLDHTFSLDGNGDFLWVESVFAEYKFNMPDLLTRLAKVNVSKKAPKIASDGTGGTYFLYSNDSHRPVLVFKPRDEEANAPNNPRGFNGATSATTLIDGVYSETGCLREVAAFLMDGGKAGVPETALAVGCHANFNNKGQEGGTKTGALQVCVPAESSCADYGPSLFDPHQVQAIAILDIRLVNADRNEENILVYRDQDSKLNLAPIDHGACLPDRLTQVTDLSVAWLEWPAVKEPLSEDLKEYVMSLDAEEDARVLGSYLGFKQEPLRLMRVCTRLLQVGTKLGLTLHDIGQLLYRSSAEEEKPSKLENLIDSCLDAALAKMDNVGTERRSGVDHLNLFASGGGEREWGPPNPVMGRLSSPVNRPRASDDLDLYLREDECSNRFTHLSGNEEGPLSPDICLNFETEFDMVECSEHPTTLGSKGKGPSPLSPLGSSDRFMMGGEGRLGSSPAFSHESPKRTESLLLFLDGEIPPTATMKALCSPRVQAQDSGMQLYPKNDVIKNVKDGHAHVVDVSHNKIGKIFQHGFLLKRKEASGGVFSRPKGDQETLLWTSELDEAFWGALDHHLEMACLALLRGKGRKGRTRGTFENEEKGGFSGKASKSGVSGSRDGSTDDPSLHRSHEVRRGQGEGEEEDSFDEDLDAVKRDLAIKESRRENVLWRSSATIQ